MAKSVDVRLTNTVPDAARDASTALRGELADALADTAREIVRGAQGRVPIRTGAAQASLRVEKADDAAMIVAGGTRAPYFHILEYGSKFVRGGHYIGQTAGASVDRLEAELERAVIESARQGGFDG